VKKLRLYDHLGQLVKEFDVYVEGQSFTWRADKPEAIWLGTITLQDVDEKVEEVEEAAPEPEVEVASEKWKRLVPQEEVTPEPEPEPEEEPRVEGIIGLGALAIVESLTEKKEKEEVESEPEKSDDKSLGDTRTGEAEQPESREVTPEADITPSVAEGSKGHRQSKSPKSAVGSRARKRTTGSSRGKAKGTTVKEVK